MSGLSKAQEGYYAAWADRAESGDLTAATEAEEPTAAELDELTAAAEHLAGDPGAHSAPEPPAESEKIDAAAAAALLSTSGRPTLSGPAGTGPSPKRQVRLPVALDRALSERAKAEGRRTSDIIRDALDAYLRAS